jgi:hypothetical protein
MLHTQIWIWVWQLIDFSLSILIHQTLKTPSVLGLSRLLLSLHYLCKGNLTDLRRILHLSLAKGNPK